MPDFRPESSKCTSISSTGESRRASSTKSRRSGGKKQRDLLRTIEQHQNANQSYLEEGVALLELATRAAALFESQDAREKRRLLDFVLLNCTWKRGELPPVFRQPFDMIADGAKLCAEKKVVGTSPDDLRLVMGG